MTLITTVQDSWPNPPSSTPINTTPSRSDWDLLFSTMFNDSLNPRQLPKYTVSDNSQRAYHCQKQQSSSRFLNYYGMQDAPSPTHMGNESVRLVFLIPEFPSADQSSIIRESQITVSTTKRQQIPSEQAILLLYAALSQHPSKPKTTKQALTQACWMKLRQEELH
ncbi:hypothetical protein Tco_0139502 [Tanacetum coccineum]